ncbi:hypothetical protein GUJ93_ZPchr0013g35723 [Zizania palustris]|uniref:Uncharacterized protein n=1 Tax=Zizania palustris TaxID=103762 RepID=A0A8J6BZJ6_ZIZPA|nr:hypothetical protein GUJ93_ZPchr0013g35723 [Zizania palustris]
MRSGFARRGPHHAHWKKPPQYKTGLKSGFRSVRSRLDRVSACRPLPLRLLPFPRSSRLVYTPTRKSKANQSIGFSSPPTASRTEEARKRRGPIGFGGRRDS